MRVGVNNHDIDKSVIIDDVTFSCDCLKDMKALKDSDIQ